LAEIIKNVLIVPGSAHERRLDERVLAAVLHAKKHAFDAIVFSGWAVEQETSEAQRMQEKFRKLYSKFQWEIILEWDSLNTLGNAQKIHAELDKLWRKLKICVLSNEDQLWRFWRDFQRSYFWEEDQEEKNKLFYKHAKIWKEYELWKKYWEELRNFHLVSAEGILQKRVQDPKIHLYQRWFWFTGQEAVDRYIYPLIWKKPFQWWNKYFIDQETRRREKRSEKKKIGIGMSN
jgi:hypothetical protein